MMNRRAFLNQALKHLAALSAALALPESLTEGHAHALRRHYRYSHGEIDWHAIRRQTLLDEKLVYLNTGTLGACPRHVFEVTQKTWEHLERNPAIVGFRELIHTADEARKQAARFIGADEDEVAFTQNTTEGMNWIAQAVGLHQDDEILTTNHEHPGGVVGWKYVCQQTGARLVRIDLNDQSRTPEEIVALFRDRITPRTRVISVSHVLFSTGLRMPIELLSQLAREHELFLAVDGAQAPGMLRVDVHALGCDSYASSSHKWLMAPKGSGILYLRKAMQKRVVPVALAAGFGAYTANTGTRHFPGLVGHGAAIDWQQILGPERIETRVLALSRYAYERLAAFQSLRMLRPRDVRLDSGMLAFALTDRRNRDFVAAMQKQGIVLKVVPMLNAVRVSTHIYNDERDIDRLIAAMQAEGIR
ncbi:MAG: aminotransferase class V-fold PLP-dependent enzyme [candidate division KSB1 bacterium]|nr:aminotransferase class V-fold PLP-dependent enzyme [candidate division KSB1 bacterium]